MPILNWIGKEKIVSHDKEVPFRLLKKNKKYSLGESENLIVEGDNLEALKALMPFYYGQVKCIYIDPPYNTGNEKWVYNDKVNSPKIKEWLGKVVGQEGEDLTRHDKWLCMMYPRLKLLRDLLSNDGVIFVSIDDNEVANLRIIMNEVFNEDNFLAQFSIKANPRGNQAEKYIATTHEYVIAYARCKESLILNKISLSEDQESEYKLRDEVGYYREIGLRKRGAGARRVDSPTLFFPIYYNPQSKKISLKKINTQFIEILPKMESGEYGRWRWSRNKIEECIYNLTVRQTKKRSGNIEYDIFEKNYIEVDGIQKGTKIKTILDDKKYNYENGKDILRNIFNNQLPFDYPKPIGLIGDLIFFATKKNDVILDSFAGSGTTAHAVLDLNKEDGGNRKFILVEMEKYICRNITAERIRRVAKGYSYKKNGGETVKAKGLGSGFEYVELGETLFNSNGMINESVSFIDMASYVFFTETHTNLDKNKIKENYIGGYAGIHYFLLFDGIGKNILNRSFLKELKAKEGRKIVYADKCLLDEEILEKYQIIFKQIPYQVKIY